jgi:hypothetical protein
LHSASKVSTVPIRRAMRTASLVVPSQCEQASLRFGLC